MRAKIHLIEKRNFNEYTSVYEIEGINTDLEKFRVLEAIGATDFVLEEDSGDVSWPNDFYNINSEKGFLDIYKEKTKGPIGCEFTLHFKCKGYNGSIGMGTGYNSFKFDLSGKSNDVWNITFKDVEIEPEEIEPEKPKETDFLSKFIIVK